VGEYLAHHVGAQKRNRGMMLAIGRYVSDSDNQHHAPVALLGSDVVGKIFPNRDPLGKTVTIDGEEFTVIGVCKPVGTVLGQSQDNFIYIPVQTWLKMYGLRQSLTI